MQQGTRLLVVIESSNRTFMELKLEDGKAQRKIQCGSNRTFMELK